MRSNPVCEVEQKRAKHRARKPPSMSDDHIRPVYKRTIILAITPRSGSTQLCSMLDKDGRFGAPTEFFNTRGTMQRQMAHFGVSSLPDLVHAAADAAPEVFVFKVAWPDWQPFAHRAKAVFPAAAYVFLDRHDTDAQAVSLYRAAHTGAWHRRAHEPPGEAREVPFDPVAIERARATTQAQREGWSHWFFDNGIVPLPLMYEHLTADPDKVVAAMCSHALIAPPTKTLEGDLTILRDATSEHWCERLRRLRRGEAG